MQPTRGQLSMVQLCAIWFSSQSLECYFYGNLINNAVCWNSSRLDSIPLQSDRHVPTVHVSSCQFLNMRRLSLLLRLQKWSGTKPHKAMVAVCCIVLFCRQFSNARSHTCIPIIVRCSKSQQCVFRKTWWYFSTKHSKNCEAMPSDPTSLSGSVLLAFGQL